MTDHATLFDQLNIETPEQVDLRLPVAGIGSRFLAILADHALQFLSEMILIVVTVLFMSATQRRHLGEISDTAGKWLVAGIVFVHFLLFWGYFSLFEAYWNGQTPGKRLVGIRVIKDSGRQITLFEALARNLLRVVDAIPSMYFVGVISMLCNRQHKRLGDFVAGTIVVHQQKTDQPLMAHNSRGLTASLYAQPPEQRQKPVGFELPADAVARLGPEDLHVIESFFARALDLDLDTRAAIARRIAASLSARMDLPLTEGTNPERLLEAIAYAMRSQSRF